MRMLKHLAWGVPVAGAVAAGVGVDRWLAAAGEAKQDLKPAVTLPLTRVVLFSSGVGYFSRSGEVEGDARVDLAFPEAEVNDLLKSMTLEDLSGRGHVSAVSYDSREPIARTLSSFAVNLSGNPTLAGVVGQLRGERVEVAVAATAANQPGKLAGAIVGVEHQKVPAGQATVDAEVLNLWCADGLRAVRLSDVQSLRFSNPVIESEFRRALEVLALTHDSQKKAVALHFAGEGKRTVRVGYVVEAPIWKTSYRLLLDAGQKEKPHLQGWAVVENPTDEDWAGVKMALVSGRPISFRMDLYNPLYIQRPTVEPELFASLRPPTYRGDMGLRASVPALGPLPLAFDVASPVTAGPQDHRQVFNFSVGLFGQSRDGGGPPAGIWNAAEEVTSKFAQPANPSGPDADSTILGGAGAGAVNGELLRRLAGQWGNLSAAQRAAAVRELTRDLPPKFEPAARNYFAALDRQYGTRTPVEFAGARIDRAAVAGAATGAALGDFFQYAIDRPVTLARQKSALLPIVARDVEATRVSIYNPAVQAKHPLLGLRLRNTSGAHLSQGPVTVFEGSVYAGDTRVLDVQPGEERLLSYAIDLGTEVDPKAGAGAQRITGVKAVKGVVSTTTKVTEETAYRAVNRSQTDRALLIEHPNRTGQQFKLVGTPKPEEDTPEVFRFRMTLKAGEAKTFTVKEERDDAASVTLAGGSEDQIRYFISLSEASPALKKRLEEALAVKSAWDAAARERDRVAADLQRLSADQDRVRKNLRETPKEAEVYGAYLKKLSDQEKEIDALTAEQKGRTEAEFAARKRYEDHLADISG